MTLTAYHDTLADPGVVEFVADWCWDTRDGKTLFAFGIPGRTCHHIPAHPPALDCASYRAGAVWQVSYLVDLFLEADAAAWDAFLAYAGAQGLQIDAREFARGLRDALPGQVPGPGAQVALL